MKHIHKIYIYFLHLIIILSNVSLIFFIISILFKNDFLIKYIDNIYYFTIGIIIIYHSLYFDYIKHKIYNLPRNFNYKNVVEKNYFDILNLKSIPKKITYYDYIESCKNGFIVIKNKSGLIDIERYEKDKEQIKHYLKIENIKIEKYGDNGIIIDTKDRLNLFDWNGEEFLKNDFVFFGMDSMGEKIFIELNKMTHYFINGQSGSGKSVFITQILNGLIYNLNLIKNIFLIDFKGGLTFDKYKYVSKKIIVGDKVEQLKKIVDYVYNENKRRMKYLKGKGWEKLETDPIFLIFDEWSEVVESCPSKELDKKGYLEFKQMLLKIESIGQLGRSQNIKLFIQTQRGGTEIISSKLRGNLQSRINLKVDNNDGVKMCLGSLDYLEKVGNVSPTEFGPGRFIFLDNSSPKGVKVHLGQSSFITPNEYIKTSQKIGIKINDFKGSKKVEKVLNDTKPIKEEIITPEPLKMVENELITHSDNVELRKELFSMTSKITDIQKQKELRTRLTKINTLIKSNDYDIYKVNQDLKDIQNII